MRIPIHNAILKIKKHSDIYNEYKEITFPKNIVNSDGKVNYKA